jgi:hypothetical protein
MARMHARLLGWPRQGLNILHCTCILLPASPHALACRHLQLHEQTIEPTSDAEGITTGGHVHAVDRVRVARGAVVHMTFSPTCLFARLHAPRIVWPACKPAANDFARVGAHACACARAACSPALGHGQCPFRLRRLPAVRARALTACQPACRPSRLSLLSGAARSAPSPRLFDYRLPAGTPSCRPQNPRSSPCRRYRQSLPSRCACLPSLGPLCAAPAPRFRRLPSVFT